MWVGPQHAGTGVKEEAPTSGRTNVKSSVQLGRISVWKSEVEVFNGNDPISVRAQDQPSLGCRPRLRCLQRSVFCLVQLSGQMGYYGQTCYGWGQLHLGLVMYTGRAGFCATISTIHKQKAISTTSTILELQDMQQSLRRHKPLEIQCVSSSLRSSIGQISLGASKVLY